MKNVEKEPTQEDQKNDKELLDFFKKDFNNLVEFVDPDKDETDFKDIVIDLLR